MITLTIRKQPVALFDRPAGSVIVFRWTRALGPISRLLECQVFSDN